MSKRREHVGNKKVCQRCKTWKFLTNYNNDKSRWDGLHPWCRECWRKQERKHYKENKESCLEQSKEYYNTVRGRYISYTTSARVRGIEFKLTEEDFGLLISQPCYYCDEIQENFNGVDRIDNTKGYIKNNCVSCCSMCNRMKNIYTEEEFIMKCKQIVEKQEVMSYRS